MFTPKTNWMESEKGVSPVIGVILMVAITVILAAVIALFVLNIDFTQNTPNVEIGVEQENVTYWDNTTIRTVSVEHRSGDELETTNVQIVVNSNTGYGFVENSGNSELDVDNLHRDSEEILIGNEYQIEFASRFEDGINTGDTVSAADFDLSQGTVEVEDEDGTLRENWLLTDGDSVKVVWTTSSGSGTLLKDYTVD